MRRRWKALVVLGIPILVAALYLLNSYGQGENLFDVETALGCAACIILTLGAIWALDYTFGSVVRGMLMLNKAISVAPDVTDEDPAATLENPSPPNPLEGA